MPDVIGYTLCEAERILEAAGIAVASVKITKPPRNKIDRYDGQFRVVKLRCLFDKNVELIVCKPL